MRAADNAGVIAIRPATPGDVDAVLPMVAAICALHEAWDPERYDMLPDVVERYRRWLPVRAVDPTSVFLVAEGRAGGKAGSANIVGFLIATVEENVPIYRTLEFGFIHDVWVEPDVRGRGVGRELVGSALAEFRARGIGQVRLETASMNEAARKLFASCGFRVGTVDMVWVGAG